MAFTSILIILWNVLIVDLIYFVKRLFFLFCLMIVWYAFSINQINLGTDSKSKWLEYISSVKYFNKKKKFDWQVLFLLDHRLKQSSFYIGWNFCQLNSVSSPPRSQKLFVPIFSKYCIIVTALNNYFLLQGSEIKLLYQCIY